MTTSVCGERKNEFSAAAEEVKSPRTVFESKAAAMRFKGCRQPSLTLGRRPMDCFWSGSMHPSDASIPEMALEISIKTTADDSRLYSSHTDLGDALEAFNQLINQRDWSTIDQSVSLVDSEKDLCIAIYALQDFNYGAVF